VVVLAAPGDTYSNRAVPPLRVRRSTAPACSNFSAARPLFNCCRSRAVNLPAASSRAISCSIFAILARRTRLRRQGSFKRPGNGAARGNDDNRDGAQHDRKGPPSKLPFWIHGKSQPGEPGRSKRGKRRRGFTTSRVGRRGAGGSARVYDAVGAAASFDARVAEIFEVQEKLEAATERVAGAEVGDDDFAEAEGVFVILELRADPADARGEGKSAKRPPM